MRELLQSPAQVKEQPKDQAYQAEPGVNISIEKDPATGGIIAPESEVRLDDVEGDITFDQKYNYTDSSSSDVDKSHASTEVQQGAKPTKPKKTVDSQENHVPSGETPLPQPTLDALDVLHTISPELSAQAKSALQNNPNTSIPNVDIDIESIPQLSPSELEELAHDLRSTFDISSSHIDTVMQGEYSHLQVNHNGENRRSYSLRKLLLVCCVAVGGVTALQSFVTQTSPLPTTTNSTGDIKVAKPPQVEQSELDLSEGVVDVLISIITQALELASKNSYYIPIVIILLGILLHSTRQQYPQLQMVAATTQPQQKRRRGSVKAKNKPETGRSTQLNLFPAQRGDEPDVVESWENKNYVQALQAIIDAKEELFKTQVFYAKQINKCITDCFPQKQFLSLSLKEKIQLLCKHEPNHPATQQVQEWLTKLNSIAESQKEIETIEFQIRDGFQKYKKPKKKRQEDIRAEIKRRQDELYPQVEKEYVRAHPGARLTRKIQDTLTTIAHARASREVEKILLYPSLINIIEKGMPKNFNFLETQRYFAENFLQVISTVSPGDYIAFQRPTGGGKTPLQEWFVNLLPTTSRCLILEPRIDLAQKLAFSLTDENHKYDSRTITQFHSGVSELQNDRTLEGDVVVSVQDSILSLSDEELTEYLKTIPYILIDEVHLFEVTQASDKLEKCIQSLPKELQPVRIGYSATFLPIAVNNGSRNLHNSSKFLPIYLGNGVFYLDIDKLQKLRYRIAGYDSIQTLVDAGELKETYFVNITPDYSNLQVDEEGREKIPWKDVCASFLKEATTEKSPLYDRRDIFSITPGIDEAVYWAKLYSQEKNYTTATVNSNRKKTCIYVPWEGVVHAIPMRDTTIKDRVQNNLSCADEILAYFNTLEDSKKPQVLPTKGSLKQSQLDTISMTALVDMWVVGSDFPIISTLLYMKTITRVDDLLQAAGRAMRKYKDKVAYIFSMKGSEVANDALSGVTGLLSSIVKTKRQGGLQVPTPDSPAKPTVALRTEDQEIPDFYATYLEYSTYVIQLLSTLKTSRKIKAQLIDDAIIECIFWCVEKKYILTKDVLLNHEYEEWKENPREVITKNPAVLKDVLRAFPAFLESIQKYIQIIAGSDSGEDEVRNAQAKAFPHLYGYKNETAETTHDLIECTLDISNEKIQEVLLEIKLRYLERSCIDYPSDSEIIESLNLFYQNDEGGDKMVSEIVATYWKSEEVFEIDVDKLVLIPVSQSIKALIEMAHVKGFVQYFQDVVESLGLNNEENASWCEILFYTYIIYNRLSLHSSENPYTITRLLSDMAYRTPSDEVLTNETEEFISAMRKVVTSGQYGTFAMYVLSDIFSDMRHIITREELYPDQSVIAEMSSELIINCADFLSASKIGERELQLLLYQMHADPEFATILCSNYKAQLNGVSKQRFLWSSISQDTAQFLQHASTKIGGVGILDKNAICLSILYVKAKIMRQQNASSRDFQEVIQSGVKYLNFSRSFEFFWMEVIELLQFFPTAQNTQSWIQSHKPCHTMDYKKPGIITNGLLQKVGKTPNTALKQVRNLDTLLQIYLSWSYGHMSSYSNEYLFNHNPHNVKKRKYVDYLEAVFKSQYILQCFELKGTDSFVPNMRRAIQAYAFWMQKYHYRVDADHVHTLFLAFVLSSIIEGEHATYLDVVALAEVTFGVRDILHTDKSQTGVKPITKLQKRISKITKMYMHTPDKNLILLWCKEYLLGQQFFHSNVEGGDSNEISKAVVSEVVSRIYILRGAKPLFSNSQKRLLEFTIYHSLSELLERTGCKDSIFRGGVEYHHIEQLAQFVYTDMEQRKSQLKCSDPVYIFEYVISVLSQPQKEKHNMLSVISLLEVCEEIKQRLRSAHIPLTETHWMGGVCSKAELKKYNTKIPQLYKRSIDKYSVDEES